MASHVCLSWAQCVQKALVKEITRDFRRRSNRAYGRSAGSGGGGGGATSETSLSIDLSARSRQVH